MHGFRDKDILSELSMGPFYVTQSNPAHRPTDPTQPNPIEIKKSRPNPTQWNDGAVLWSRPKSKGQGRGQDQDSQGRSRGRGRGRGLDPRDQDQG